MDFRSDNVSGAHPAVLAALGAANRGHAAAYGADAWTERVRARLSTIFEREVAVFPVATGTAANALALALHVPPWGAVYCHPQAHIQVDECGAPELFSGGCKLVSVPGASGKLRPADVEAATHGVGFVHSVQPAAVSISQASESGTVYRAHEIGELSELCRRYRMALHMDGARFANALVTLGASPAELTWRSGVDVLSLGATKNGCFAAEAVVLFDPTKAEELGYRRKRAGHLLSKLRFVSAQLDAYLSDDLWLANARHANAMARRLEVGLTRFGLMPLERVEANEVFVRVPEGAAAQLRAAGYLFYDWFALGPEVRRLVTAFDTRAEDVDAFLALLGRAAA